MRPTVLLMTALLLSTQSKADIISEIGGGVTLPYTSEVMSPQCQYVFVVQGKAGFQFDGQGRQKTLPCGGSDPVFVGWPIAWESANGNTRVGWFHFSHWFSGVPFNRDSETSYNCLCASHKFHWRKR